MSERSGRAHGARGWPALTDVAWLTDSNQVHSVLRASEVFRRLRFLNANAHRQSPRHRIAVLLVGSVRGRRQPALIEPALRYLRMRAAAYRVCYSRCWQAVQLSLLHPPYIARHTWRAPRRAPPRARSLA